MAVRTLLPRNHNIGQQQPASAWKQVHVGPAKPGVQQLARQSQEVAKPAIQNAVPLRPAPSRSSPLAPWAPQAPLTPPAPQAPQAPQRPVTQDRPMNSEELEQSMAYRNNKALSHSALGRSPEEVSSLLQVVALGSSCGVKLTIRRLNLDEATMPFDWIRTSVTGIVDWLSNDFTTFFRSPFCRIDVIFRELPMTVYRSTTHSFWHDDIEELATRERLWRRVQRFMGLHTDTCQQNNPRQLLFVRTAAGTHEIAETELLYKLLQETFGANGRQVWFLLIVDDQPIKGPILHSKYEGLMFWVQPITPGPLRSGGDAPGPYEDAISFAVKRILSAPSGMTADGQPGANYPYVSSAADILAPASQLRAQGLRDSEAGMWCGMVLREGDEVETQFCAFEGHREREVPLPTVVAAA